MAQVTPEASMLNDAAEVAGAQKALTLDDVITLPSSPPTPSTATSITPSTILDRAAAELSQLREDL